MIRAEDMTQEYLDDLRALVDALQVMVQAQDGLIKSLESQLDALAVDRLLEGLSDG